MSVCECVCVFGHVLKLCSFRCDGVEYTTQGMNEVTACISMHCKQQHTQSDDFTISAKGYIASDNVIASELHVRMYYGLL